LIQGGSVFSSYHRRAITSSGRRRRAWAHAGDDRERIAGWPGEADRMRVGPPMGQDSTTTPCLPRGFKCTRGQPDQTPIVRTSSKADHGEVGPPTSNLMGAPTTPAGRAVWDWRPAWFNSQLNARFLWILSCWV